jgi:predicted DNA-binding transcriptional regulator AlpA
VQVDIGDLLNAREVASLLGLAHREAVTTYRRRYVDFPEPVIHKGTCVMWHRPDIERWAAATGRTITGQAE